MQEKLTFEELLYVQNELKMKGKKTWASYLLLFTIGTLGIHYAYLEKTKMFLLRILLTIVTLASLYPFIDVISRINKDGVTRELQLYGSSLITITSILLIGGIAWLIYDTYKVPEMVRSFNLKIEKEAGTKIYVSRNVNELMLRNEASRSLIERTSEIVKLEVGEKINTLEKETESRQERIEKMNSKNKESLELIGSKTEELEGILTALLENAERKKSNKMTNNNRRKRRR